MPDSKRRVDASAASSISPTDHTAGYSSQGQAWAKPLVAIDKVWTRFDVWLCTLIVILEVTSLALWVSLKGLSTGPGSSAAGIVFRALTGATVFGTIAYVALYRQTIFVRRLGAVIGVALGFILAKAWARVGVDYASNWLNWYQQASTLTLVGGLRGVATRLTLLLALIGGSLATAAGKHITIDLVTRYVTSRVRVWMAVTVWLLSSVICAFGSWGFFDHIAIENFHSSADAPASQKIATVGHGLSEYAFAARKQIALDFRTLPRVIKGEVYTHWLTGTEWNEFLESSGFVERYGKDKVELIKIPPESTRSPIVTIPEKGEPRGALTDAANLVFPIGLLIISLRFLLLSLLTISGHMKVDPEAHFELGSSHRPDPDTAEG